MTLGAIVLAAGKGTRMRSPRSKLLHTLLGEPMLFFPFYALHQAGVRSFVVVVGHESAAVEHAVRALPFVGDCQLTFVQQGEQRGTGHAVQVALASVTSAPSRWLIAYGDSPHLDAQTLTLLAHAPGPLSVLAAEVNDPHGYGRMVVEGDKLLQIVEQKDATDAQRTIRLVNAGAYAVEHAFLAGAIAKLQPKNAQNELYLTDIAQGSGANVTRAEHSHVVLGVNSQQELMRSQKLLQLRMIEAAHEMGVSVESEDVVIGPRVTFASGAVIERGVTLLGNTHVGDARVEHHAHLHNVQVADGARVKAFTYAEDSIIGTRAVVGPMSRLRAGAQLEEAAEVGNFCEVKKTKIGRKAKSHHVSYLGDADIGAGTNIGAGTIICNYNGFTKPFSRIGADVFIGSNSTLIAPVDIGDRAYVGAGSAITDPVPADALAIGRARQVTKEGYANTLKAKLKK